MTGSGLWLKGDQKCWIVELVGGLGCVVKESFLLVCCFLRRSARQGCFEREAIELRWRVVEREMVRLGQVSLR